MERRKSIHGLITETRSIPEEEVSILKEAKDLLGEGNTLSLIRLASVGTSVFDDGFVYEVKPDTEVIVIQGTADQIEELNQVVSVIKEEKKPRVLNSNQVL